MNWQSYFAGTTTGLLLAVLACWADWTRGGGLKPEPIARSAPPSEYIPVVVQGRQIVDQLYEPHSEIYISARGYDSNYKFSSESLDKKYPWPVRVLIVRDP